MNKDDTKDINELIEDYLKLRIQIEILWTEFGCCDLFLAPWAETGPLRQLSGPGPWARAQSGQAVG